MARANRERPIFDPPVARLVNNLYAARSEASTIEVYSKLRDDAMSRKQRADSELILISTCAQAVCGSVLTSDAKWKEFVQLAQSIENNKSPKQYQQSLGGGIRLRNLAIVAALWSVEVVHHYGWNSKGEALVKKIRACAVVYPNFSLDLVPRLNKVLLQRHCDSIVSGGRKRTLLDAPLIPSCDLDVTALRSAEPEENAEEPWLTSTNGHFSVPGGAQTLHSLRPQHFPPYLLHKDRYGVLVVRPPDRPDPWRPSCGPDCQDSCGTSTTEPENAHARGSTSALPITSAELRACPGSTEECRCPNGGHLAGSSQPIPGLNEELCSPVRTPPRDESPTEQIEDSIMFDSSLQGTEKDSEHGRSVLPGISLPTPSTSELSGIGIGSPGDSHGQGFLQAEISFEHQDPLSSDPSAPGLVVPDQSMFFDESTTLLGIASPPGHSPLNLHCQDHVSDNVTIVSENGSPVDDAGLLENYIEQRFLQSPRPDSVSVREGVTGNSPVPENQPSISSDGRLQTFAVEDAWSSELALGLRPNASTQTFYDRLLDVHDQYGGIDIPDQNQRAATQTEPAWLTPTTRQAQTSSIIADSPTQGEEFDPHAADVIMLHSNDFLCACEQQTVFRKPVIIKEKHRDSGMHTVVGLTRRLKTIYPDRDEPTYDCPEATPPAHPGEDVPMKDRASPSDIQHLGNFTRAHRPLFTMLHRFCLLDTLLERARHTPTSQPLRSRNGEIDESFGFNILGLKGASSGPCLRVLSGAWIRVLDGKVIWLIIPEEKMDWDTFHRQGKDWQPCGEQRVFILEQDDVLFIPPGSRLVYSIHSPTDHLMEGGIVWDELNILQTLQSLTWAVRTRTGMTESIRTHLTFLIPELKDLIMEDPERFCNDIPRAEFLRAFGAAVEDFTRALSSHR